MPIKLNHINPVYPHLAAGIAIDQMTSDIRGKAIPDQHGSSHVAIAKINYDITGYDRCPVLGNCLSDH